MSNRITNSNTQWVERILDLPALLKKKSHFLFGPRQTGKTFLIRHTLKDVRVYDLLDTSVYLALSQNPGRIAQELTPRESLWLPQSTTFLMWVLSLHSREGNSVPERLNLARHLRPTSCMSSRAIAITCPGSLWVTGDQLQVLRWILLSVIIQQ